MLRPSIPPSPSPVGAGNDGQFKILTAAIGAPDLAADARFSSNAQRVANRDVLIPLLEELLRKQTAQHWIDALGGRVPAAPIRNIKQTFEHPQAVARGVTTEVDHPRAGRITISAPAVRYGEGKMPVSARGRKERTRVECSASVR
jgi:succinate--hydroxymethylglutarate CoA-transferase